MRDLKDLLKVAGIIIVSFGLISALRQITKQKKTDENINNPISKLNSEGQPIYNNEITIDTIVDSSESKIEEPKGKWIYEDEIDKMTSKHMITASVKSNNIIHLDFPYNGGSESYLTVRRWKGELDIYVSVRPSQIVFDYNNEYVNIRIDDLPSKRYAINKPSDYSSDVFFIRSEKSFLQKLKKSKKVLVEVIIHDQGVHVLEFDTDNLEFN